MTDINALKENLADRRLLFNKYRISNGKVNKSDFLSKTSATDTPIKTKTSNLEETKAPITIDSSIEKEEAPTRSSITQKIKKALFGK